MVLGIGSVNPGILQVRLTQARGAPSLKSIEAPYEQELIHLARTALFPPRQWALDKLARVDQKYRERILAHEAAHFLVGYCLGAAPQKLPDQCLISAQCPGAGSGREPADPAKRCASTLPEIPAGLVEASKALIGRGGEHASFHLTRCLSRVESASRAACRLQACP